MRSRQATFRERAIARVDRAMMLRTVAFVQGLANRLAGDRLSLRVTPADVAGTSAPTSAFYGCAWRWRTFYGRPLPFYYSERCTYCTLIVYLREIKNGPDLQVFFSEKSRNLLQNQDGRLADGRDPDRHPEHAAGLKRTPHGRIPAACRITDQTITRQFEPHRQSTNSPEFFAPG